MRALWRTKAWTGIVIALTVAAGAAVWAYAGTLSGPTDQGLFDEDPPRPTEPRTGRGYRVFYDPEDGRILSLHGYDPNPDPNLPTSRVHVPEGASVLDITDDPSLAKLWVDAYQGRLGDWHVDVQVETLRHR